MLKTKNKGERKLCYEPDKVSDKEGKERRKSRCCVNSGNRNLWVQGNDWISVFFCFFCGAIQCTAASGIIVVGKIGGLVMHYLNPK